MGPYNGQIGNIRAGLMGTEMPPAYGGSMPNPAYQPPPMPVDNTQIHMPNFSGQSGSLHVSHGAAGMHDMFELARKNPAGSQNSRYSSLADEIQAANSGTNAGGGNGAGSGYSGM